MERVKRRAAEDQAHATKSLQDQITILQAQNGQLQFEKDKMNAQGAASLSLTQWELQRAQLASSQQLHGEVDNARREAERANELAVEALEAAQAPQRLPLLDEPSKPI